MGHLEPIAGQISAWDFLHRPLYTFCYRFKKRMAQKFHRITAIYDDVRMVYIVIYAISNY